MLQWEGDSKEKEGIPLVDTNTTNNILFFALGFVATVLVRC